MTMGTVKWFDPQKGFGFIISPSGCDVFVHYSGIDGQGFRCLRNGQAVEYQEIQTEKGLQGKQVKPLSPNPSDAKETDPNGQALP
jgi:CspA family cold shock protein